MSGQQETKEYTIGQEVARAWAVVRVLQAAKEAGVEKSGYLVRAGTPLANTAGRDQAVETLTSLWLQARRQAEVLQELYLRYADPGEV